MSFETGKKQVGQVQRLIVVLLLDTRLWHVCREVNLIGELGDLDSEAALDLIECGVVL
jgi:hypothetical protein